jgi:DNA-binding MarR family transcriptional regulator
MDAVYNAPGYLFRRMQQIAVSIFVEECRAFDLTPVQYAALVAIHTHPGIDATRLSAVIAFDRSTLGNVIERLESKSLVERKPSRDDKRVKLLHLTKPGAAALREIMPMVDRAQMRMLQPLKPADRKTLLALMTQLANARRFGVDVSVFPRLLKAEAASSGMKAFADAAPYKQNDAE